MGRAVHQECKETRNIYVYEIASVHARDVSEPRTSKMKIVLAKYWVGQGTLSSLPSALLLLKLALHLKAARSFLSAAKNMAFAVKMPDQMNCMIAGEVK